MYPTFIGQANNYPEDIKEHSRIKAEKIIDGNER